MDPNGVLLVFGKQKLRPLSTVIAGWGITAALFLLAVMICYGVRTLVWLLVHKDSLFCVMALACAVTAVLMWL